MVAGPDILNISERPAEADDRAVPGHWEGDLVFGKRDEPGRHLGGALDPVRDAGGAARRPQGRPGRRRAGRGDHHPARSTDPIADLGPGPRDGRARHGSPQPPASQVYFCDPKTPWQRGSNENTNGLLRQYLPRTLDFRTLTQADFDAIADKLNGRPRQTLGFKTPSQALAEVLR